MANEAEVDGEIDVAKIMERIRENIRKRKGIVRGTGNETGAPTDVERDLNYINSSWQIQNNSYFISSHRPILGKFLIKGRELVHGEVRRYVDPIIFKQNEFNASAVRLFNESIRRLDDTGRRLESLDALEEELKELFDQSRREMLLENRKEIEKQKSDLEGIVEDKVRGIVAAMNEDIENRAWLASLLEKKTMSLTPEPPREEGVNYFVFEDRFRGSREDVKRKEALFLRFFEGCSNVLDIGCGRGEFLELLRGNGIGARGVDIDEDMVVYCRSRGLAVENIDAISYLEKQEDKSLDGIFVDQVAEHLKPDYLISMLRLCHQKLIYGHFLVVETVNPLSLTSLMNFYIDQSHKRPLHPETLHFLMETAGFREIETKFLAPMPDKNRLKKVDSNLMEKKTSHYAEVYNHNIDMLNSILYGPQDYALIGKK
ncbi:MAG TPA: methionine biosynthesis protein MetW [Methanothrix sp.]|nr:methionine biosynthesis protein MetW [Methanothrix sp.]